MNIAFQEAKLAYCFSRAAVQTHENSPSLFRVQTHENSPSFFVKIKKEKKIYHLPIIMKLVVRQSSASLTPCSPMITFQPDNRKMVQL